MERRQELEKEVDQKWLELSEVAVLAERGNEDCAARLPGLQEEYQALSDLTVEVMIDLAAHDHKTSLDEHCREYELTEEQMRESRARCAGAAPMQQLFYVLSCQARDWGVPIPKGLEVYYERYKRELE